MRRFISTGLASALLVVLVAGCGNKQESESQLQPAPTVTASVMTVAKQTVTVPYEAVGTVRSKLYSTIRSEAMGAIKAVNVREGDSVTKDQVLIEIDDRDAVTNIQKAESALKEAQAMHDETDKAIAAARRAQEAANADSELAALTHERFKNLEDSKAVSRQVSDEAGAKWKSATAQAAQAAETVLSYEAKRNEADARIEHAKAELSSAQVYLSHTKVLAPFDGIVTRKNVDVGDLASPGTQLLDLEMVQQYRLEATVDEALMHRFTVGDSVPIVLDAVGKEDVAGIVAEIVPSSDPASRSFIVKVDLPQGLALKSGMFGRARFSTGQREALVVPVSAVVRRGQLTGVFAVDENNVARMRLITIGKQFGENVEVLSGLDVGEKIVVDGSGKVVDGCVVQQG